MKVNETFHSKHNPPDEFYTYPRLTYHLNGEDEELLFLFYGQIASYKDGTRMTAMGNHYLGGPAITDGSTIKDIVLLESPSFAPSYLNQPWNNQISVLTKAERSEWGKIYDGFKFEEKTSILCGKDSSSSQDLIKFTTDVKYRRPQAKDAMAISIPEQVNLLLVNSDNMDESNAVDTSSPSGADNFEDSVDTYTLYEPSLQEDYRGDFFRHQRAKSAQLPYYDVNERFIRPWEVRDKLREGTLVTIRANLVVWLTPVMGRESTVKKSFQLRLKSLKVFASSDIPLKPIVIPQLLGTAPPQSSSPRKRSFAHFSSYSQSPSSAVDPSPSSSASTSSPQSKKGKTKDNEKGKGRESDNEKGKGRESDKSRK
ncbi:hypothetical protein BDQ17DRAFT_1322086 [Cyathus striatus]|nr:hypothetical protein BDQ17DRAFT_1322086 [Cyathus striatus]